MQRVLSFQMTRDSGESSKYVTKRLCFSTLFSMGFLCLFCGFMLCRFVVERSQKLQELERRAELDTSQEGNGLQKTKDYQQQALQELERASFNYSHVINWEMPDSLESNMQRISEFFSNLSIIDETTNHTSCVRAISYGVEEPDTFIILSVNEDGIAIALELMQILDRIYSTTNWLPRRSIVFCVSLVSSDVCPQTLPAFMKRNVAYVAVHGSFLQADGDVVLSGSDIMRSIAVEAIKTIPDNNWTYLEYENFGPRLLLDMPQVTFSYSDFALNQTHHNQSLRSRSVTLAQMVYKTVWWLSESIVIQWEPKYFNETVNRMLESIDSDKLKNAKKKLQSRLRPLLYIVKYFNTEAKRINKDKPLDVKVWNDLIFNVDKMFLCSDENAHSRTDLTTFHELSLQSTSNLLNYLDEMTKCYQNVMQVYWFYFKIQKIVYRYKNTDLMHQIEKPGSKPWAKMKQQELV